MQHQSYTIYNHAHLPNDIGPIAISDVTHCLIAYTLAI